MESRKTKRLNYYYEAKHQNYRTWKAGKSWVYAAATLSVILGAGVATAAIKPQVAGATTTNSTVSSESTAVASNSAGYSAAVSNASAVNSTNSVVTSDAKQVNNAISDLTSTVNNDKLLSDSGASAYKSAITSASNVLTSQLAVHSASNSDYQSLVNAYNSDLSAYQASGSQVPPLDLASYSNELASLLANNPDSAANLGSLTSTITSTVSNNLSSGVYSLSNQSQNLSAYHEASNYYQTSVLPAYTAGSSVASELSTGNSQLENAVSVYNSDEQKIASALTGPGNVDSLVNSAKDALSVAASAVLSLQSTVVASETAFSSAYKNYATVLASYQAKLDAYSSVPELSTGNSDFAINSNQSASLSAVYSAYTSQAESLRVATDSVLLDNGERVSAYAAANSLRNTVESDILSVSAIQQSLSTAVSHYNSLATGSQLLDSQITAAYNSVVSEEVIYSDYLNSYFKDGSDYQSALRSYALENGMSSDEASKLSAFDSGSLSTFNVELTAFESQYTDFKVTYSNISAYLDYQQSMLAHQSFPTSMTGTDGNQATGVLGGGTLKAQTNVVVLDTYSPDTLNGLDLDSAVASGGAYGGTTSTVELDVNDTKRYFTSTNFNAILNAPLQQPTGAANSWLGTQQGIFSSYYVVKHADGTETTTTTPPGTLAPGETLKTYQLSAIFTSYVTSATHGSSSTKNNYYLLKPTDPIKDFTSLPVQFGPNQNQDLSIYFVYMLSPELPSVPTPPAPIPLAIPAIQLAPVKTLTPPSVVKTNLPPVAPQAFSTVTGMALPTPPAVALAPTAPGSSPTKDVTKTENGDSIDDSNLGATGNTENTTNDPNTGNIGLDSNFVYELNSRTLWAGQDPLANWSLTDKFDAANDQYLGTYNVYQITNGVMSSKPVDNSGSQYFTQTYDNAAGTLTYTATQAWLDKVNAAKNDDVSWRIDADFYRYTNSTDVQNSFEETVNKSTEESNTVNTHTNKPQPHKFDLNDSTADLTNNNLLNDDTDIAAGYKPGMIQEPDGTFTQIVDVTGKDPFADGTGNNSPANINTATLNRGDHIGYQLWLDTTPYDNTSLLTGLSMSDSFDTTRLDANANDVHVYDAAGNDVTKYFTASISGGTLTVTANISSDQQNGLINPVAGNAGVLTQNAQGKTEAILNTKVVPLGSYYKISFPTTIKSDAPAGDIVNVANQTVVDNNGKSTSEKTETRVNKLLPLAPKPTPPARPTPPPAKPIVPVKPKPKPEPTPPPAKPTLPDTGDTNSATLVLSGIVTIGAAGVVLMADRKKRKYQLHYLAKNSNYK